MLNILKFGLLFLFIISCSSGRLTKSGLVFSKKDLNQEELKSSYLNIHHINTNTEHKQFIKKIEKIKNVDIGKCYGVTNFKVYIDEYGDIESIFLKRSVNYLLDSLALKTLKNTKFLKLKTDNKFIKYSVHISYPFLRSGDIIPIINGKNSYSVLYPKEYIKVNDLLSPVKVDKMPVILNKPQPKYPNIARMAAVEGTVIVTVLIDENGYVEKATIFRGEAMLYKASINTAYECKFEPAIKEGKPVKVKVNIPFHFQLL